MADTTVGTAAVRTPGGTRRRGAVRFARHYAEMVLAMLAGMIVPGIPAMMAIEALGWSEALSGAVASSLLMATAMATGMVVWMRYRRHRWGPTLEMAGSMYAAFAVLYPFHWAGLLDAGGVMTIGHVLMFPAMGLVMLARRDEYTH